MIALAAAAEGELVGTSAGSAGPGAGAGEGAGPSAASPAGAMAAGVSVAGVKAAPPTGVGVSRSPTPFTIGADILCTVIQVFLKEMFTVQAILSNLFRAELI